MRPEKHLGLAVAIVEKRADDEKHLGRVQVRFPTMGNRVSDWIRVVVPFGGAANGKHGFFWIPEEGDEVLVGYDHGDPKGAVVLGSLYGVDRKPPITEVDHRTLQTRQGHHITVSDKSGGEFITVKTKKGQHLTIDEEKEQVTLHAGKAIEIDTADQITIKAKNVKVEATNVVVDAKKIDLGGSGASEPVVLGNAFMTLFNTHTHPETGATTSPPATPMTPAVLSKITKLTG